ncbi:MAG: hypothetical protein J6B98_01770 [Bacilli bacterium]|nr:hypothetical protein [Bacilli bacterium]
MVSELFVKVVSNINNTNNFEYYKNLIEITKEECDHIPVILGDLVNVKGINLEEETNYKIQYKKCLLCGEILTYTGGYKKEFDARSYFDTPDLDPVYADMRYNNIIEEFKNVCKNENSEEEVYEKFEKILLKNNKILKRTKSIAK